MSFWKSLTGNAQNLGEYLYQLSNSFKALFGDKDAAMHYQSLYEVNEGKTAQDREILERVETASKDFKHTGILGTMDSIGDTVRGFFKGITSLLGFSLKNIQWIIIFGVVGYAAWVFIKLKKGK